MQCFRSPMRSVMRKYHHHHRSTRNAILSNQCRSFTSSNERLEKVKEAPSLKDFMRTANSSSNKTSTVDSHSSSSALDSSSSPESNQTSDLAMKIKFHIETYGCQMNTSDSDIVRSILLKAGYEDSPSIDDAHLILTNTCAIRENAETKVFHRLDYFQSLRDKNYIALPKNIKRDIKAGKVPMSPTPILIRSPLVGVLGCMAERLKEKLLDEKAVDLVCGPDAYRDLPRLISIAVKGASVGGSTSSSMMNTKKRSKEPTISSSDDDSIEPTILTNNGDQLAANTMLSLEETYADITPIREAEPAVESSAFVSIMRGCNNMCSFCIVPFTRGRERSRPIDSITKEIRALVETPASSQGNENENKKVTIPVREVVLLGQNVNGYHDISPEGSARFPYKPYQATEGFNNLFRSKRKELPGPRFVDLLEEVSNIHPDLRVRFTSPHPKDFPVEVLDMIASKPNICKSLHLPLQSGSTSTLARMRRGYTKEAFLRLVELCREKIPDVSLSTDVIAGFCGETEEEHLETIDVMKRVSFDHAFMFAYSLRDRTHAAHTMTDDVTPEVKQRRLQEIIDVFNEGIVKRNNEVELGKYRLVLVEGSAKRSVSHEKSPNSHGLYTGRTDGNKRVVFTMNDNNMIYSSMKAYETLAIKQSMEPMLINSSLTSSSLMYKHMDLDMSMIQYQQQLASMPYIHDTNAVKKISSPQSLCGTYVVVKILKASGPTLRGVPVTLSNIQEFHSVMN